MRGLGLIWIAAVAVVFAISAAGETALPVTDEAGDGPLQYRYYTVPTLTSEMPDYFNGGVRSDLWMPIRSVSEIPDGPFILGPFIPENYHQHWRDSDLGIESRIQTTISLDGDIPEYDYIYPEPGQE